MMSKHDHIHSDVGGHVNTHAFSSQHSKGTQNSYLWHKLSILLQTCPFSQGSQTVSFRALHALISYGFSEILCNINNCLNMLPISSGAKILDGVIFTSW